MKLIDVLNAVTESAAQQGNRAITETLKKVDGKWALVSKTTGRPLQYYHGHGRPSDEWVKKVERRIHAFESIGEGEGDPEGLEHVTKELLQHIVTQIDTEGAHAIVKSLEWGDGASRELLQLIKQDLENHIKTIAEGEGDPEGIPHLTKSFLKNILKGVDEEGAHSIVKSLQWGDGAAKELLELIATCLKKHINVQESIKQRLDPNCWKGKHKEGTKIKSGVRVNNCVPNESVAEGLDQDLPSVLYHATYKPRLKTIKLKGLGAGGKRNWEDSKRGVVYLALDPNVAESYAESSDMVPDEWLDQIVILKISTAGLDPNKFYIDSNVRDNAGDTVEYHGVIPLKNISLYKQGVAEGKIEEQSNLVSQFLKSISPKELRYYSIRDNCGPAALHMRDWAQKQGIDLKRHGGYFVADNVVSDKADFTKEMKRDFLKQGLDFNDPNARKEFIESNPEYSEEWKKVPHYWLQDKQGNVYDPTGYIQFIKTGLARDLDSRRYLSVNQGVAEGFESLDYQGNCTEDDVVDDIFGDVNNFANMVEKYGDEFTRGNLVVKYDPKKDVHYFYCKKQGVAEDTITEDNLSPDQQFDIIEEMVDQVAAEHGVDPELIWEDFEVVDDATLLETAAWKRKEGKNKTGGLNAKGIASYRKENPGSKLQAAVTTKPSKLKPGSKAAKRRKSFCARMSGMEGPMKDEHGKPTRKALALRKWNC